MKERLKNCEFYFDELCLNKSTKYKYCPYWKNKFCKDFIDTKDKPYHIFGNKKNKNKELALQLHDEGFSIRQIMKKLNYKSPRSISILLEKSNKLAVIKPFCTFDTNSSKFCSKNIKCSICDKQPNKVQNDL